MDEAIGSQERVSETHSSISGEKIVGPNTLKFLEDHQQEYPSLVSSFSDISFRFQGEALGQHSRGIFIFPGIGRRPKNQEKSKNEFRDDWIPQLSLPRAFAQVEYPDHTFVSQLLTRQFEDLALRYKISELDLIGVSFGAMHVLPLAADIHRRKLPLTVKTATLVIPGIQETDLTWFARLTSRALGASAKAIRRVAPTSIAPHLAALGIRSIAFPEALTAKDLPPDMRIKAFIAKKDELFDPQKAARSLRSISPKANIEWISGGHRWSEERISQVNQSTIAFIDENDS